MSVVNRLNHYRHRGTGVYRYPLAQAAHVCIATIDDYLRSHSDTSLRRIVLAMFGADEYDVFCGALAGLPAERQK